MGEANHREFKVMGVMVAMFVLFLGGCTHQLDVKNLRSYQNMSLASLEKTATIGIIATTDDIHSQKLVKAIARELAKYSANVLLPYSPAGSRKVDVIGRISIRADYKGSGWNFLINFPGFLIFTPAWHGYIYKVNYDVDIQLAKASDNKEIDSFTIPVHLNIRHAGINRTWTEISWLEVGAIAFIGGIVFTQYDHNVSPLLLDKIDSPIGDYIAQEIVNRINNFGDLGLMRKTGASMSAIIQRHDDG